MQRLFSKSQAAFIMSVGRLFDGGGRVYFWTLTFVNVHNDDEYGRLWTGFWKGMSVAHGSFRRWKCPGIRVIEPHESHGLHFHFLTKKRLSVHIVRRIGKRFGIGRIDVQKCDRGAGLYLSKYLGKSKSFGMRVRSWGAMGGFLVCRKSDVEVDSSFHRNMAFIVERTGGRIDMGMSTAIFQHSLLHGDMDNWSDKRGLTYFQVGKRRLSLPGREIRDRYPCSGAKG